MTLATCVPFIIAFVVFGVGSYLTFRIIKSYLKRRNEFEGNYQKWAANQSSPNDFPTRKVPQVVLDIRAKKELEESQSRKPWFPTKEELEKAERLAKSPAVGQGQLMAQNPRYYTAVYNPQMVIIPIQDSTEDESTRQTPVRAVSYDWSAE